MRAVLEGAAVLVGVDRQLEPTRSKAVKSATLEAARLSPRGGGGAPSGRASPWECRAAQSRQARPEEAQGERLVGHCDPAALLERH